MDGGRVDAPSTQNTRVGAGEKTVGVGGGGGSDGEVKMGGVPEPVMER